VFTTLTESGFRGAIFLGGGAGLQSSAKCSVDVASPWLKKRRGLGPRRSSSGLLLVQSATPFEAHFAFEALFVVRALLAVGALGCRLATSIVTAHVAFAALLVLHALVAIGWALGRGLTTSIVTAHVAFAALLVLHALVAIGWALGRFPASVLRMGDALAVAATTDARDVT
jgi:hypothetical protein